MFPLLHYNSFVSSLHRAETKGFPFQLVPKLRDRIRALGFFLSLGILENVLSDMNYHDVKSLIYLHEFQTKSCDFLPLKICENLYYSCLLFLLKKSVKICVICGRFFWHKITLKSFFESIYHVYSYDQ